MSSKFVLKGDVSEAAPPGVPVVADRGLGDAGWVETDNSRILEAS